MLREYAPLLAVSDGYAACCAARAHYAARAWLHKSPLRLTHWTESLDAAGFNVRTLGCCRWCEQAVLAGARQP